MNFIKSLFVLWVSVIFISLNAQAKNIKISSTLSLDLDGVIQNQILLSKNSSMFFEIKDKNTNQYLVTHTKPDFISNKFSIDRLWTMEQKKTAQFDTKIIDHKCKKVSTGQYMCSRQVIQNSKSVAEAIYWNGTKDLVSIRVTSPISTSEAEKNLLKLK